MECSIPSHYLKHNSFYTRNFHFYLEQSFFQLSIGNFRNILLAMYNLTFHGRKQTFNKRYSCKGLYRFHDSEKASRPCKYTPYGHLFLLRYGHNRCSKISGLAPVNIDFRDIINTFLATHQTLGRIDVLLCKCTTRHSMFRTYQHSHILF